MRQYYNLEAQSNKVVGVEDGFTDIKKSLHRVFEIIFYIDRHCFIINILGCCFLAAHSKHF